VANTGLKLLGSVMSAGFAKLASFAQFAASHFTKDITFPFPFDL